METQDNGARQPKVQQPETQLTRASGLSREDELLLSRYYDGECNFLERWRVRRILGRNQGAEEYLDSLNEVGKQLCSYESSVLRDAQGNSIKVDLWDRISSRIEVEERAALFLGERPLQKGGADRVSVFDFSKVIWGLSGSFATAAIVGLALGLGFVQGPRDSESDPFATAFEARSSNDLQNVALTKAQKPEKQGRRPIEVDWVRSDGSVHMIPDPGQRSAILWVKRKRIPIIDIDKLRDKESGPRSDRPVIIEDKLPRSLSVAGPSGR